MTARHGVGLDAAPIEDRGVESSERDGRMAHARRAFDDTRRPRLQPRHHAVATNSASSTMVQKRGKASRCPPIASVATAAGMTGIDQDVGQLERLAHDRAGSRRTPQGSRADAGVVRSMAINQCFDPAHRAHEEQSRKPVTDQQHGQRNEDREGHPVNPRSEPWKDLCCQHDDARRCSRKRGDPRTREAPGDKRHDQQVRVVRDGDPFPSQRRSRGFPTAGAGRKISRSLIQKFANDAIATAMTLAGRTGRSRRGHHEHGDTEVGQHRDRPVDSVEGQPALDPLTRAAGSAT